MLDDLTGKVHFVFVITRHKLYEQTRKLIGEREYVAHLLGIHVKTLYRRETNRTPINDEMMLALMMLKSNHQGKTELGIIDLKNNPNHVSDKGVAYW